MAGLATLGCSRGDDQTEISGSTNWLQCSKDADCDEFSATCGDDGYCVDDSGERISADAESNEPEAGPNASGPDGSTAADPTGSPANPNVPSPTDAGSTGTGGSSPDDASAQLEPEVTPTGSMDAGSEPAPDAGPTDPCAYLSEPEMKSCETDADCSAVFRRNCCGGSIVGINAARETDYEQLEPACDATIDVCECQEMLSLAEDDRYAGPSSTIGAECVSGQCRSFVDQAPCGDAVPAYVADEFYDDFCSRDEVCVRYRELVAGMRADTYACVASACGGSSDCTCSAEVCGPDFPDCFDSGDVMMCSDGQ